jgi:hypothetical protein
MEDSMKQSTDDKKLLVAANKTKKPIKTVKIGKMTCGICSGHD